MAIFEIPSDQVIDYSPNGDDIDSFSQKTKYCIEEIFKTLQALHAGGAGTGAPDDNDPNAVAGAQYIDTGDGSIYIRNTDNTEWVWIGTIDKYWGITARALGALETDSNYRMGRLYMGSNKPMPTDGVETYDLYFDTEAKRIFYWTGTEWEKFLSRHFEDSLDYEQFCLSRAEASTAGEAGKLLRIDPQSGKANVNITGSPDMLCGYQIDTQNLRDGHALVFNAEKQKFVNLPNYEVTRNDTTYIGGVGSVGKLIRVGDDGMLHADLANLPLALGNLEDGQILMYHEAAGKWYNENLAAVGAAKALTLKDGENLLGYYNGNAPVTVDLHDMLNKSSIGQDLNHLTRLVGNLYLALDESKLNPYGYDGFSGETFRGGTGDLDLTEVNVRTMAQGSDELVLDTVAGLIEGSHYFLVEDSVVEAVQIDKLYNENGVNRAILATTVAKSFTGTAAKLSRKSPMSTSDKLTADGIYIGGGDAVSFVSNLIPFVNEATDEDNTVSRAHLSVKHDNVADIEMTAELALRNANFVKGEVIGIGTGAAQTVTLANTTKLSHYKFAVYFNGVAQQTGVTFSADTGTVTFTAPNGTIVAADYFYNWGEEIFTEMTKTGTYPDRRNPDKATTQFSCASTAGTVATLRLTFKRGTGTANNEVNATATGNPQGFKLKHILRGAASGIKLTPSDAVLNSFNSSQNVAVVTAPAGSTITLSYGWRGKSFNVDSFACVFND